MYNSAYYVNMELEEIQTVYPLHPVRSIHPNETEEPLCPIDPSSASMIHVMVNIYVFSVVDAIHLLKWCT
jgi:hypothetical protein